jgi:hypothetical protein
MSDEREFDAVDARERRLFAALPRESDADPRELDHLIGALRAEGFLRRRRAGVHWSVLLAASVVFAALGGVAGARIAMRSSLEAQLERTDMSVSERILLMQRAGSAYVRASNAYAGAVAQADSTAVEVASRVLLGAAQAVARSKLDGGIAPNLTAVLRAPSVPAVPAQPQRVIWF